MSLKLKLNFSALGILVILGSLHHGQAFSYSESGLSIFGKLFFTSTFLAVSDLHTVEAIPPFFHRTGPVDSSISEEDSDEDDNESQARVEPQITPLNRDECLAKLLCGMSVPVTGGGAPKNGYYSEYANIVGKFFDAFPLEEDEEKSIESIEALDDYSSEDDDDDEKKSSKPSRLNSKNKKIDVNRKGSSTGLQLIDLAIISKSESPKDARNTTLFVGSSGMDRSLFNKRIARAKKIVSKLGEKLQTVRQCQQISGCPFTFKQLRSKLKTDSSISSNVPLGPQQSTKKYVYKHSSNTRPKPKPLSVPGGLSTELVLGNPNPQKEVHKDSHKGDDELEEYFGPPPILINRPPGFGGSQSQQSQFHPPGLRLPNQPQNPQIYQNQNQDQLQDDVYVPYDPLSQNKPTVSPAFPKRPIGYKPPAFVNKKPTSDSDEFDDVNKSTGPISMIGSDFEKVQLNQNNNNRRPIQTQITNKQQQLLQQYQQKYQYKPQPLQQQFLTQQLQQQQYSQQLQQQLLLQQQLGQGQTQQGLTNTFSNLPLPPSSNSQNNNNQNQQDNNNNNNDDDDDYDDDEDYEYEDEEYEDDENDNEESNEEEDEEDEEESDKKTSSTTKVNETEPEVSTPGKKKIKYKNPDPDSLVIIEEEFEPKKPTEDDELEHPENFWSKLQYATSSALIKHPKNPTKTELQQKNDEKLNLSKETSKETSKESSKDTAAAKDSDESEEEEEEDEDDETRRRSTTSKRPPVKPSDDDEQEEENKSIRKKRPTNKFTYDDSEEFGKVSSLLSSNSKPRRKTATKTRRRSNKPNKSDSSTPNKAHKKKIPQPPVQSDEEDSVEMNSKKKPQKPQLLEIGGRPLVPPPEKETKQTKKTGALSRFNFNLVRPYAPQIKEEAETYPKIRSSLPTASKTSNNKNSYKSDITDMGNKESYLPAVSFGSSNGGKVGNVEFLGMPSTPAQKNPSLITFPFASPLTSFASFFKRPVSSSSANQDIPGGHAPPVSAFVHRPIGPESNKFKRDRPTESSNNRARSGNKKTKGKKSKNTKKNRNSSTRTRTKN